MNSNPAELLNPILNALDGLIEDDGVYLYLVFVWLAVASITWIVTGGFQKRLKRNAVTVIPRIIMMTRPPRRLEPSFVDIEVEQAWNDDDESTD